VAALCLAGKLLSQFLATKRPLCQVRAALLPHPGPRWVMPKSGVQAPAAVDFSGKAEVFLPQRGRFVRGACRFGAAPFYE